VVCLCEAAEGLHREHRMRLSQSNYRLIGDWIDTTETMELLFGKEDVSEFIITLETKLTANKYMTRYRFVNIPPVTHGKHCECKSAR
jgi:hypothetical protein